MKLARIVAGTAGWNWRELGLAAGLAFAAVVAIAPRLVVADERAKVARVRSALRATAIALDAYFVDRDAYPASGRAEGARREYRSQQIWQDERVSAIPTGVPTANSFAAASGRGAARVCTFRADAGLAGLTTPIAYLEAFPEDPFAATPGAALAYFAHGSGLGWIAASVGPDRDENAPDGPGDVDPRVEVLYDIVSEFPYMWTPPPELVERFYDPTNGVASDGDLVRCQGE